MNQPAPYRINFDQVLPKLPAAKICEYDCGAKHKTLNVTESAFRALQTPLDFPPMSAAIVPGDRVALAVDPNVPQLNQVIQGIIDALSHTEAGAIDIVLWDEATDKTIESLRQQFGEVASIARHQCDDRSSLRYLAADEAGEALYLNNLVVDADFALPVIAYRAMDRDCRHDLTGVYPSLTDSATRNRHQIQMSRPEAENNERNEDQIPWLLGVSLIMSVTANALGKAGDVVVGTPEAIAKQVTPVRRVSDDFPPLASLVIASLDGDAQQQTWQNAARAAVAAVHYTQPGGTIVLWTAIDAEPTGKLCSLDDFDHTSMSDDDSGKTSVDAQGAFPEWQANDGLAASLARVSTDFRILVHSRLPDEVIESIGIGCIKNADELTHLCNSHDSCGVMRGAQYVGATIDAPYRWGIKS